MDTFSYKGIAEGKYVEGDIEALNQEEASHKLKEQKVIITNLVQSKKKKDKVKEKSKKGGGFSFGKKKVKVEEILIFSKQFATMVKAGLPILEVLGMLRDQLESPAIKEVIEDIRKSLEGGVTLSKCFEKYPQYFDNVYCNLIKAGEASGKLDVFLLKIVDALEKKEKIKKKIKGALMYPGIMFSVAIIVSAFMLVKVVPVFAKMYEGIALPTPTAVIMAMSDFLRGTGGMILVFGGIGGFFVFRYLTTKNETIKYKWHKQVLKMPVFGDMILKSLLARISLILGNLSAAGVNLLESLEIAKSVSNNVVVTEALENVKKGVFSGDTLTKLFLKEPLFPPTFSQLISVGEQTGQLDEMFNSVAMYYEEEFDNSVDNMSSLIEPIMIVFMGIMIGGLMIAMYSPIFNVGALIG